MKKLLLYLLLAFFIQNVDAQNWGEQILNQPNTAAGYAFGNSVDVDGDFAVISAPGENDFTGSVHIYKKDENGVWAHHQKIEDFVRKNVDNFFGFSTAVQGDYVFIGSFKDRIDENNFQGIAGSVAVYKKNANDVWSGIQKIRSSDLRVGDFFGGSIAIHGNYLVVGAKDQDYDANNINLLNSSGAAYIFKKDNNDVWNQVQKITPTNRNEFDNFGKNVDIYEDYIIVASNKDTNNANEVINNGNGSVFIFKKDNNDVWSQVQKIKPNNSSMQSRFGFEDISVFGDYIAVAATGTELSENNNLYYGFVYIFKKDGNNIWQENQILKVSNGEAKFGSGIALDNNVALISAPSARVTKNGATTSNVGKSYLFVRNANDEYLLAETIQASQVIENSQIGVGIVNQEYSYSAVAVKDNQFILGASNTKRTIGNTNYFTAGTAYISGDLNALGVLNIKEMNDIVSITTYPNPTNGSFFINLKHVYENVRVSMSTVLGKTLYQKKYINKNKLDLEMNYPSGIYFVKVTLENDSTRIFKVIKN